MSDDARMTVSPAAMRIGWSRPAIRDSADIGSPCDPVEISTTSPGGISSASRRSIEQPAGHVQVAELAGDAHVADHGPADEGDLAPVLGRRVEHLLHPVHVARRSTPR